MLQTEKLNQPWLKWLEEDSKYYDEGSWQVNLNHILMEFLLSENSDAAAAARQIDTNYSQEYVAQDRLVVACLDQGMENYLWFFYEILFSAVKLIPYDDARQKNLVQLLVELQRLPARPFLLWDEEFTDMVNNPILGDEVRDKWNAYSVSDDVHGFYTPDQLSQLCAEWINFSAFFARCEAAQLEYFNSCPGAGTDIPQGLEPPTWPMGELSQEMKNCYVKVAANYLIIEPEMLYGWFVLDEKTKAPTREWGVTHWRMWAKSLEDLEKYYEGEGENDVELLSLVKQARRKVLEVGKDLFVDEEVEGDVMQQLQNATVQDQDGKQIDEKTELVGEASVEKGIEKSVNDIVGKQTDAGEGSKASGDTDEVTPNDGAQTKPDAVATTVAGESHDTTVGSDGIQTESDTVTTAATEESHDTAADIDETQAQLDAVVTTATAEESHNTTADSDGMQIESDSIVTTPLAEENHDITINIDETQAVSDAVLTTAATEENHDTTVDIDGKGEAEIVTNSDSTTAVKENTGKCRRCAEKDT